MDYRTKCKIIIPVEETIGENLHDWGLGDVEIRASQVALVVKNLPANAGDLRDLGSIPGLGKSPGGGLGNPLQYSCLEKSHGQRSLVGYSPQGHKETDTTEHAHTQCQHLLSLVFVHPLLTKPTSDTVMFQMYQSMQKVTIYSFCPGNLPFVSETMCVSLL